MEDVHFSGPFPTTTPACPKTLNGVCSTPSITLCPEGGVQRLCFRNCIKGAWGSPPSLEELLPDFMGSTEKPAAAHKQ